MSLSLRGKRRGLHVRLTTLVVAACAMVAVLAFMAQAASAFVPCPSGGNRAGSISEWETLWGTSAETAKGVTMCLGEEGFFGTDKGYLQIVDLTDGAKIRLHADVDPESPASYLSQPDTIYRKRVVEEWYSWLRTIEIEGPVESWDYSWPSSDRLFSVTNATFFTETDNDLNTTVPLPVLTLGEKSSLGVAWRRARDYEREERRRLNGDYEAPKKVVMIGEMYNEEYREQTQSVRVGSFPTHYEFETRPEGPFISSLMHAGGTRAYDTMEAAVGFTPEYDLGGERQSKRRNYVGTYGSIVYIFTSDAEYTNEEATAIMQEIQPGMEVIQLDGGGSASLYSDYGEMDSSVPVFDREVPNVLAIYRAP
jgi:hypothetical protein